MAWLGVPMALLLAAYAGAYPALTPGTPAHAAAVGGSALAPPPETALPDPFPIMRVFLAPERRDAATQEVARGTLRKLAKADFEALVQTASRVRRAAQNPSRIEEATYRASVQPGRVQGTATWLLTHPHDGGGAMPVDPLPGAIREPKWADGRTPILYRSAPEGKIAAATFLAIEDPPSERFEFGWSARILQQPDEERCTLAFPASSISSLELGVPADRLPTIEQAGVLLTGPYPSPNRDERLWKLSFGGQTRLDLTFRKTVPSDGTPAPGRGTRSVVWNLSRTEFVGQFDFGLQPMRSGIRERTFAIDPGLDVTHVAGADVENWEWKSGTPRQLRVGLRVGPPTTRVTIHARASAMASSGAWTPPQIRMDGASLGGDTLEVRATSDFKLEGWTPGDYRIGKASTTPDRVATLAFVPTPLVAEDRTERRPPTIRLRPVEQEFSTVESLVWRPEPDRSRLSATFAIAVRRGPISTFAFQASAGYRLESVNTTPDDPGATFGPQPGVANGWLVEPSRALATGQSVDIRLEFREVAATPPGGPPNADGTKLIPLPRVSPLGTAERIGTYTVRPLGGMKVSVAGFAAPQTPLVGEPGFSVAYRGREPDGDLLVSRARPAVSARLTTAATSGPGAIRASSTLTANIEGTALDSLLVWMPSADVRWQFEPSAGALRLPSDPTGPWLPLMGSASPWTTAALAGLKTAPRGSLWRITPTRPILGDFTATANYDWPRPVSEGGPGEVPLPKYFGVPVSESTPKPDATPRDTARPPDGWEFRDLQLLHRIESGDRIRSTLRGTVVRAGAFRLPIPLVCDRLKSVLLDGKWLAITHAELAETGLPIPKPGTAFEVQFTSGVNPMAGGLAGRAEVSIPPLPGEPAIPTEWSAEPEFVFWPGPASRIVVAESTLRAASGIAAILILACAVGFGARNRTIAILGTAALGAACGLAPAGWSAALKPPLAAAFAGVVLATFAKRRDRAVAPLAIWIAAALGFADASRAQAPEPAVVFVVPGPADHPERISVLAPRATIEKLVALGRSPLPETAILSAEYDCLAIGDTVTVKVKYAVHSTVAEERMLAIPLAGVRLEKALLDGKEAFPDAAKPDRFLVPIRGAGPHELTLQFAVAVQTAGLDREAKFAAPDLPVTHVGFAAGLGGRQIDVLSRSGGQTLGLSTSGLRVEAEHGGGRAIHLRWREGGAADGAKATMIAKEGAVWDLGTSENLLTAAWQCRVDGGTVTGVKLELPEGVLPSVVSADAPEGTASGAGIRSWKVGTPSGGFTPIDVRFQNPVEGRFTLILKGYSAKLPSLRLLLTFPRIAGVADADRDSFHAVRLAAGLRSDGIGVAGAIDFPAAAVEKEFSKVPEFNFVKLPPTRVVQRAPGKATELRPVLLPTLAYRPLAGEAVYTLGRRIEVEGAMRVEAQETGTAEFDVPAGLILRDVWSPDLAGWSRSGSRIQARWTKPVAEAIVRWSGHMPNPPAADGTCEFALPRWPSSAAGAADPLGVRVRAALGWKIAPQPGVGVKVTATASPEEWLLTVEPESNPTVKFSTKVAPKPEGPTERPTSPVPPTPATPPRPSDSVAIGGPPADGPSQSALTLRAASWFGAGIFLALLLVRGGTRLRPEALGLLGLMAATALGAGSNLAWPFWLLAGCAALVRAVRVARRAVRFAFG